MNTSVILVENLHEQKTMMKTKSRIQSILNASSLERAITGIDAFHLSELELDTELDFPLPNNLRLGHMAERVVAELIRKSSNYEMLFENLQLIEDGQTIGEIDFIIQNLHSKYLIHLELAYKFYLYDPSISANTINNWIGPNRNDSLKEKLDKLKSRQFPLIHHNAARTALSEVNMNEVSQALCLLASMYIPYEYDGAFGPDYHKAIKGYYIHAERFYSIDHSDRTYHLPTKLEWGMSPSDNESWVNLDQINDQLATSIREKQSLLCWQKHKDSYSEFFITWW